MGRSPIYERWGLPLSDGNSPPQLPGPTAPVEPVREEPAARGGGAALATLPAVGEVADLDWPGASDRADEPGLADWRRMAPIAAGALLSLGVVLVAALGVGGGNDIGPGAASESAGRGSGAGNEPSVTATPPPTVGGTEVEALPVVNGRTIAAVTRSSDQKATPRRDPVASPVIDPAPPPPGVPPPPPTTAPPPPTTAPPPPPTTEPPPPTTEPPPPTTEPPPTTTLSEPPPST